MINELTWDSAFFDRKMGELKIVSESLPQIKHAVEIAKKDGFKYVICKMQSQQTALIKLLESLGFYLSDIGVIWATEAKKFVHGNANKKSNNKKPIKIATEKDIRMLQEIVKSLFLESRFYSDPFFSKEEADHLYQTWIENSVKGNTADIVFCIPDKGFITCKKLPPRSGEIALIGVKKDLRGKGIGTILIEKALRWFETQGITLVSVRTQLKNLSAMNFYVKLGFHIKKYDIIFAKIL